MGITKDQARSMGADRASEDKGPNPPPGWSSGNQLAYLEGFIGAAEDWAEDLKDRAALADEMADEIRQKRHRIMRVSFEAYHPDHGVLVLREKGGPRVIHPLTRRQVFRALGAYAAETMEGSSGQWDGWLFRACIVEEGEVPEQITEIVATLAAHDGEPDQTGRTE